MGDWGDRYEDCLYRCAHGHEQHCGVGESPWELAAGDSSFIPCFECMADWLQEKGYCLEKVK